MCSAFGVAPHGDAANLDLVVESDALDVALVQPVPDEDWFVGILHVVVVGVADGGDVLGVARLAVTLLRQPLIERRPDADPPRHDPVDAADVVPIVVRRVEQIDRGEAFKMWLPDNLGRLHCHTLTLMRYVEEAKAAAIGNDTPDYHPLEAVREVLMQSEPHTEARPRPVAGSEDRET